MGIWTCIQPMGGETKLADVFASHFWVYRRPSNSSLDGIGFKFIDFIVIWNIFLYIPLKYLRNWMGYLCFVIWVRYNILAGEKNPAMRGKHARLQYSGQNTPWGILSAWDRFCILSFQSWWLVLRHVNWNPCSFQAASKIQFSFFPAWKVWGCCFMTKQIFGYANLYWPRTLMNIGKTTRTLQVACKCIGEIHPTTMEKVFPFRFYGDGADTTGLNAFELLTMISVAPNHTSSMKTRFVFPGHNFVDSGMEVWFRVILTYILLEHASIFAFFIHDTSPSISIFLASIRLSVRNTQYTSDKDRETILTMLVWSFTALCVLV